MPTPRPRNESTGDTRARGARAELHACRFLQAQGLQVVQRNYRCRWGEIDLVMRQGSTLVFVEVRYRSGASHGGALASIDHRKRRRLLRTAEHFLQARAPQAAARFDVVALQREPGGGVDIQWLRDAFAAD